MGIIFAASWKFKILLNKKGFLKYPEFRDSELSSGWIGGRKEGKKG